MRAFALLFLAACSAPSHAQPQPTSGAESPALCAEQSLSELLAAANLEGEVVGEPVEYSAQLDGQGERETILSARMAQSEEPDDPMSPVTLTDHLVVFECQQSVLVRTADWTFDATPDDGTIECEAGVVRVDMQRVPEREMLVVTTHQCQGSVDPRWDDERMLFLAYAGEGFDEAFSCSFLEDHATGPCRSGASIRRRINVSDEQTPTIHVTLVRSFDPGACEDEEAGPGETDLNQEATYSWNGSAFVSSGEDVCQ